MVWLLVGVCGSGQMCNVCTTALLFVANNALTPALWGVSCWRLVAHCAGWLLINPQHGTNLYLVIFGQVVHLVQALHADAVLLGDVVHALSRFNHVWLVLELFLCMLTFLF